MTMEKFEAKKEPMVPRDKQEEFAAAAAAGGKSSQESEKLEADAKNERTLSKVQTGSAVGLGGMGVAAAFTGNPIGAGIGALAAAGFGLDARASKKKAARFSERAQEAKRESEGEYKKSRTIVQQEMRDTGAELYADGEIHATPEQIEIARKEMYDNRQSEYLKEEGEK